MLDKSISNFAHAILLETCGNNFHRIMGPTSLEVCYALLHKREVTMNDIQELINQILKFREARDWKQFHNSKDMAISLVLEATELLEHFQWKSAEEVVEHIEVQRKQIGEELADILYWVLLLSHDLDVDIKAAFMAKMEKNAKKYPVDKAKGTHKKYTELRDN